MAKNKKTNIGKAGKAAKLFFIVNALLGLVLIGLGVYTLISMLKIQTSSGYSMMTSDNITTIAALIVIGIVILLIGWIGNIVIATFGKIEKNVAEIRKDSDELISALHKEVPEEETTAE